MKTKIHSIDLTVAPRSKYIAITFHRSTGFKYHSNRTFMDASLPSALRVMRVQRHIARNIIGEIAQ